MGGETALNLAGIVHKKGIKIIGTSYDSLDIAEDRGRFSVFWKELDIPYPEYGTAWSVDEAIVVANKVGYRVWVRPSYVLGGQGMRIGIKKSPVCSTTPSHQSCSSPLVITLSGRFLR